jgi:3-oxoacyl-[acyl-carrier-protein] synthase II
MPDLTIVVTAIGGVVAAEPDSAEGARWQDPFSRQGEDYGVKFDTASILGAKGLRLLDRATLMTMLAAHKTLQDGGLLDHAPAWTGLRPPGLVLGTSFGSLPSISGYIRDRLEKGPAVLNPSLFPNTVVNSPASQTAIRFGLSTLCSTISAGWASGAEAIGYAADALRHGRADSVLAGGMEEFGPDNVALCRDLGLPPAVPLRDACVLLLLERADDAKARGARILAQLAGRGTGFDLSGNGRGMRMAVREASKVLDEGFQVLVAGGCGLETVDRMQQDVFETCERRLPPPPEYGLMDGARGAYLAASAVLACAGYNGSVQSALAAAPSYTGHAAALAFKRYGQ